MKHLFPSTKEAVKASEHAGMLFCNDIRSGTNMLSEG